MNQTGKTSFDDNWVGAFVGARPAMKTAVAPVEPDDEPEELEEELEGEPEEERPKLPDLRALYPFPEPACSRLRFLEDVAGHKMEVLRDENGYRHLRFKRPNTGQYWFQLTTWPGYLAITGDMGDFVFTRSNDMFAFFRPDDWEKKQNDLFINPGYWGEKCVSRDRGGMDSYNAETFKASVADWCADDEDLTPEQWAEIVSEVISKADDGSDAAYRAAMGFEIEIPARTPYGKPARHDYFQDFWERDCTEWTYSYLWCLYAIVWGIHQYDVERLRKVEAENRRWRNRLALKLNSLLKGSRPEGK